MAARPPRDRQPSPPAASGMGRGNRPAWRRRLRIVAAAAVAAAALSLVAAAALRPNPAAVEIEIGGHLVYYDFPDIVADLKGDGRRPRYVKLGIIVEMPAELRPRLEEKQTAVIDALHAYLRERRAAELVGEEGAMRVRDALLPIINGALAPDQAKAVLFRQFILS